MILAALHLTLVAAPPASLPGTCTWSWPREAAIAASSANALEAWGPDDVDDAIAAAGRDLPALLKLAEGYGAGGRAAEAKRVYERVIEIDADNEVAREALRHERYDGRWFETYVELARYKRAEAKRMKAAGKARFMDRWVPEEDLPYLQMGWVRDASRNWRDARVVQWEREAAELQAAGHRFRADDSTWVAPEDFDKWSAMLWRCGDDWLPTDEADVYHADLRHPWVLSGEHFRVITICPWGVGNTARWHVDQTWPHLVRLFGVEPPSKPEVLVFGTLEQYNAAAGGDLNDSEGYSSIYGAYYADAAVLAAPDGPEGAVRYAGKGVSMWAQDDPDAARWGALWTRWAAAQAFVDAIDFSLHAVGGYVAPGADLDADYPDFSEKFWEEKAIPRWLREGAASYAERYLPDPEMPEGGDPWTLRAFAFSDLARRGGLRPLPELFEFPIDVGRREETLRLRDEAGLLVSYLLDGASEDQALTAAHDRFRVAMEAGDRAEIEASATALELALTERSAKIREYAGF